METKPQTITITNFGGRLTRILNGDLNSGFAKFNTSFGYDPFSKPMNLTWLEQPEDITGPSSGGLMVAAKPRNLGTSTNVYAVNAAGNIYNIIVSSVAAGSPNVDSVVGIGSVLSGNVTYLYGSSMDFFGNTEKIFVSNDEGINSINFDFTADAFVGTQGNYAQNTFHPLKQFAGKELFGNGNTIGAISATGTVTSSVIATGQGSLYSELNPPLGVETYVRDLDVSPDGNYALISASNIRNEQIATIGADSSAGAASDGFLYRWNGSDQTVTAFNTIPSYAVTALQTYLDRFMFFSDDSFGAAVNNGGNKLLTLSDNKSALPNAIAVNGNFITWICPEISADGTQINASMYYFGALDQENPPGLYRVLRKGTALSNGFIYQTPLNILVSNKFRTVNQGKTAVATSSYGKHYISLMDINSTTTSNKFFRFLITSSGTGTPQLGVYETQNQLFSKRIGISQIRIYCEPTATGNGFQLDMIDMDGSVVSNGTFSYSFAAGSDPTKLQGSLERINFNPGTKTLFSLGIRITNTGTTNMVIKKVEVDYTEEGK